MKKRLFLPVILGVMMLGGLSCKKKLIPGTYESTPVAMGNGTIHSWMTFDANGNPIAIGMTLTDGALEGLSQTGDIHSGNEHHNIFEAQLPPELVTKTPFKHVAANWNPVGHTPGVYDKPHFDFHYYMISSDARKAIPQYSVDSAGFKNVPPADYLPPDFITAPYGGAAEPAMGVHWFDSKAPELPPNGGHPFEQTWIHGTYDGKVIFYEPMLTYAFLKNITDWSREIPRSAKVQVSGYYPKRVHVTHADGKYTVAIEDFEFRKGE